MSGAVTFNYNNWVARYPEFTSVSAPAAQMYFDEATIYCANKLGPVQTVEILTTLLNMVTAHIAALNNPVTSGGASPSTPPGRISNASEGSVSATFDYTSEPGSQQWFIQTKYGAAFWQATNVYRRARYRPGICRGIGPGQVPWLYGN